MRNNNIRENEERAELERAREDLLEQTIELERTRLDLLGQTVELQRAREVLLAERAEMQRDLEEFRAMRTISVSPALSSVMSFTSEGESVNASIDSSFESLSEMLTNNFPPITDEASMDHFIKETSCENKVEDFFRKMKNNNIISIKNLLNFVPYQIPYHQLNIFSEYMNKYTTKIIDQYIKEDKDDTLKQINIQDLNNQFIASFIYINIEFNLKIIEEIFYFRSKLQTISRKIANTKILQKVKKILEDTDKFFIDLKKYQILLQDLFKIYYKIMLKPLSIQTDDIKTGIYDISSLLIKIKKIQELLFSELYQNTLNLLNNADVYFDQLNKKYLDTNSTNNNEEDTIIIKTILNNSQIIDPKINISNLISHIEALKKLGTFLDTETKTELDTEEENKIIEKKNINNIIILSLKNLICNFELNKQKAIFLLSRLAEKDSDKLIEYISKTELDTEEENKIIEKKNINNIIILSLKNLICNFELNKQKAIFLLSRLAEKDSDKLIEYISNSSYKNEILKTIYYFINKLIISNIPIKDIKFDNNLKFINQFEKDLLEDKALFEYYKHSAKAIQLYGKMNKHDTLKKYNEASRAVSELNHNQFQVTINQIEQQLEVERLQNLEVARLRVEELELEKLRVEELESERLENLEVARLELEQSQARHDEMLKKSNYSLSNMGWVFYFIDKTISFNKYNKIQQEVIKNVYKLYERLIEEKILVIEDISQDNLQNDLNCTQDLLFKKMQDKHFNKYGSFDEQLEWLEYFVHIDNKFLQDKESEMEFNELNGILENN
ncbi:MAG: hypothetical protein U1E31_00495 [Rickettsiales bacterium]